MEKKRADREVTEKIPEVVLEVGRSTLGYRDTEKLDRDKLKKKAGMRAWKYKRKMEESRSGKLARACWEKKERAKKGEAIGGWEKERKQYMEKRG